jgi:hypothetical protein
MDAFIKNEQLASAFDRVYGDDKPVTAYFPDWQTLYSLGQENGLTNDQLDELHTQYDSMASAAAVGGKRNKRRRKTKKRRRKTLRKRSRKQSKKRKTRRR